MKIAHVCFSDISGGAAKGAYRIHRSLVDYGFHKGFESEMRVVSKSSGDPTVFENIPYIRRNPLKTKIEIFIHNYLLNRFHTNNPTLHSTAWIRTGLAEYLHKLRQNGKIDLIHLHWLGDYTLTIEEIGRLPQPVVWTLHDQWAFCGAEHYTNSVHPDELLLKHERFANKYAPQSRPPDEYGFDLNRLTWLRKHRSWARPMHIVCPSNWMAHCVQQSSLMSEWPIYIIPNPIDTNDWKPLDKLKARHELGLPRDSFLVLFGADGGTSDHRKGADLLIQALRHLHHQAVSEKHLNIELIIYGQNTQSRHMSHEFPVHILGRINDNHKLQKLYSAADVFVIPSRQDNLPNTGLEAHACGTPVVAFRTGGLVDIVADRITGALAHPFDPISLGESILWIFENPSRLLELSEAARRRAESLWSPRRISDLYCDVYLKAMEYPANA